MKSLDAVLHVVNNDQKPLTIHDLSARWSVCAKTAKKIAEHLGIPRITISRKTILYRAGDVLEGERRHAGAFTGQIRAPR